jgi:hypothetical protein
MAMPGMPAVSAPPPAPDPTATPDANATQQPVTFNVKITALPDEIQGAIQVLKESGMDNIAQVLEQALNPSADKAANDLQDEVVAMGANPHGM